MDVSASTRRTASYEVAAVRKALVILCSFTPTAPTLSVSDISRRLKVPKSTAHNLLRTLKSLGFVAQDTATKRYRLGHKVFELGELFPRNAQLVSDAMPRLRRLADQTKETVKFGIMSDAEVLVVAAIESSFMLHTRGDEGRRAPLHCTGLGKALLAALPDAEVREIAAQGGLRPFTPRTMTTLRRLEEELGQIRTDGCAFDWEEHEQGVRCVAASIKDPYGRPKAAISVSGPASRITSEKMSEFAALVVDAAKTISVLQDNQLVEVAVGRVKANT